MQQHLDVAWIRGIDWTQARTGIQDIEPMPAKPVWHAAHDVARQPCARRSHSGGVGHFLGELFVGLKKKIAARLFPRTDVYRISYSSKVDSGTEQAEF